MFSPSTLSAARKLSLGLFALSALASAAQAQISWRGFEGTAQLDNFFLDGAFRPPDTMGAVGLTQYVETTNGSVTVYDKATGAVLSRVGANAFWQAAGASGSAGDQRVLFDMYTNRWIMNGFCAGTNEVCIAVSDTSNALGTWRATKIVTPTTNIADYPTLAVTAGAVIIGTNNFATSGGFTGNSLYTIPRASLFGGTPSVANMTTFTTASSSADRGFAIQGATNWTGASTTSANIFTVSRDQFDVLAYKLNGVNGAGATQTAVIDLNRPAYTFNNPGRQPDALPGGVANRLVDTLDDRVSASVYEVNGRIYGIHTVTPTGVATANAYTELRYYVLDAATLAPISQGTIGGGNFDYYQGSLAVNSFGDVVVGFNRSGSQTTDADGDGKADGRITFMARVLKDNGAGVLSQVGSDLTLRVSDVGDYRCGVQTSVDTACRQRWGDYAAVTLDPSDPYSFWAIGEYADDWANFGTNLRANWHTYIAQISVVPEPGTYGLMALGLAAVGMAARRRRAEAVA
jgi:hypothetical protein